MDTSACQLQIDDLKGRFKGRPALIVCGGPSGRDWQQWRRDDSIVIVVNGSCAMIPDADFAIAMEPTARTYGAQWFRNAMSEKTIRVHHARNYMVVRDEQLLTEDLQPNTCLAFRSYHSAGWNPREYRNPVEIEHSLWSSESDQASRMYKLGTPARSDYHEEGFLKGPATLVKFREPVKTKSGERPAISNAIGTSSLSAIHLAGIMGCDEITTAGLDLCFPAGQHYWYDNGSAHQPRYETGNNYYTKPECVNEITHAGGVTRSLWWFTASAAYLLAVIKPALAAAGISWTDHSQGLLQIPGIEGLNYLDGSGMEQIAL